MTLKCHDCKEDTDSEEFQKYGGLCKKCYKERHPEKEGYEIKDSGKRKKFGTGAQRDLSSGKGRFDLLPWQTIRALAIHYEMGANKYDERNWEKGIPVSRFVDSAMRHLAQFVDGEDDGENHLISALWNIASCYETILRIQQGRLPAGLYNLPRKIELPPIYQLKKADKTQ